MSSRTKSKKDVVKKESKKETKESIAAACSTLIVRPLSANGRSCTVRAAASVIEAENLVPGCFVSVGARLNLCGVLEVSVTAEDDIVEIAEPLRKAAGLLYGDRLVLKSCARPPIAKSVAVTSDLDVDALKELLSKEPVVFAGLEMDGQVVSGMALPKTEEDPTLGLSSLSLNELVCEHPGPAIFGPETGIVKPGAPAFGRGARLGGFAAVGGLDTEIAAIRAKLELPLLRPELFEWFNVAPERGVLLYGPPGTGKTLLLRAVAAELGAHVVRIDGPSLFSKYLGETEQSLRLLFAEAERFAPSIVVIDEIDALAPRRDSDAAGETESRVVATLLTLMDGLQAGGRVAIAAATNRPNQLDPALRRPGRFGQELEIGVPDADKRRAILERQLEPIPHSLSSRQIVDLASRTHGFVGADLEALVRESVLEAIEQGATQSLAAREMHVTAEHFELAFRNVRPSAMREIFIELPKVRWSDVGGQETVVARLRETVEWPLMHSASFERLGITPPRGVLLYGPPGCSKTMLAKALATEAGLNFLAVKGPELFNKYVGESERALREVFRRARATAPSIVFFDEIDALSVSRGDDAAGAGGDRMLTTLLNEMDGIEALKNVVVIAATNRPDVIDAALMRPGRLDRLIYVPPPDRESRRQILLIQLSRMAIADDVDIEKLADDLEGCSGAEVVSICNEAGLEAMNENVDIEVITQSHFDKVVKALKRNITPEMLTYYHDFSL